MAGYHMQCMVHVSTINGRRRASKNSSVPLEFFWLAAPQAHRFCFATSTSPTRTLNSSKYKQATALDFCKFKSTCRTVVRGQRTIVVVLVRTMVVCYSSSLLIYIREVFTPHNTLAIPCHHDVFSPRLVASLCLCSTSFRFDSFQRSGGIFMSVSSFFVPIQS